MRKYTTFVWLFLGLLLLGLLTACGGDPAVTPTTQEPTAPTQTDPATLSLDDLVAYDPLAGTVSGAEGAELVPGSEITLTASAQAGYRFIGWSINAYLEQYGQSVSEEATCSFTVEEGSKYYANFLKETEVLLCYHANGGTVADGQGDRLIQKLSLGEHLYPETIPQNGTFLRPGYQILEYSTEADGSGMVANLGQRIFAPHNGMLSLYVQWAQETPAEQFSFESTDAGCYVTAYTGQDSLLVIPEAYNGTPVVGIGSNAVSAPAAQTLVLPASVTSVEDNAFAGCSALSKVYLYDSLWEMTDESFAGCPIRTVCLNSVFAQKYYGEGTGKLEVLYGSRDSGENRLVAISGSSGLFALDCELLQSSLTRDYFVVNFALQIAVPNTFAMAVMEPCLREGDAVLLAPEAELKQYNNKLTTMIFTKFDGAYTCFRQVDVSLYRSFFSSLASFSLAKQTDPDSLMAPEAQFFTYNGDTDNNRQAESFDSTYDFSSPLYHYDMREEIFTNYNLALDALADQGITCYLSFGPFCTEACAEEVTAEMLDEYSTAFGDRLHAIRISDQSSYDFPKSCFFEMYHMSKEGREMRTLQLIEDLNAQFEKE